MTSKQTCGAMKAIEEHQRVISRTAEQCLEPTRLVAQLVIELFQTSGTLFWCGNGGSAADSQHLSAELVGRFNGERKALRSIALSTNTSVLTSIANDEGYEEIFARQLEALARPGDLLIVMSTSGKSENIIRAVMAARTAGMTTVGLLGRCGGKVRSLLDHVILVPSDDTARIQEAHLLLGHCLCDLIDDHFQRSS